MKKVALDLLTKNKEIISVYTDKESTDKFTAGYILSTSDTQVLLGSVDTYGNYDGYVVRLIDDIFLVEQKTQYTQKLCVLYNSKKQSHDLFCDIKEKNLFISLLNYANKSGKIATVQLLDSGLNDVQGFVEEIVDDVVLIKRVNDCGKLDGRANFALSDITYVSCDSQEESVLALLTNLKK